MQRLKQYVVFVRSNITGELTPVYEQALTSKEVATIVNNYLCEGEEYIEDIFLKVENWKERKVDHK